MKPVLFFPKKKIKAQKIFNNLKMNKNFIINDVKPLHSAKKNDVTFFDSLKYKSIAQNTKAGICITTEKLKNHLPKNVIIMPVKNVLFELAKVLKQIYPTADIDYPDLSLKKPNKNKFPHVNFGNNVLIGKNVKLGKNLSLIHI